MKRIFTFVGIVLVAFAGIFAVKYAARVAIDNEATRKQLNEKVDAIVVGVASTLLAGLALLVTDAVSKANNANIKADPPSQKPVAPMPHRQGPRPRVEPAPPIADIQMRIKKLEAENKQLQMECDELQAENDQFESRLTKCVERNKSLAEKLERVKSFARGKQAIFYGLVVGILFAWLWPLTAWCETAVYDWRGFAPDQPPPLTAVNFLLAYLQSILLAIGSAVLGFLAYRRFFRETESPNVNHTFVIGFVGIAACGMVSLLLMNPRMWGTYFSGGGLLNSTYSSVPRIVYVGIQRLVLLPTAGYLGCLLAWWIYARRK